MPEPTTADNDEIVLWTDRSPATALRALLCPGLLLLAVVLASGGADAEAFVLAAVGTAGHFYVEHHPRKPLRPPRPWPGEEAERERGRRG